MNNMKHNQMYFTIHNSRPQYITPPKQTTTGPTQIFDFKPQPTVINRKLMNKALQRLLECRHDYDFWKDLTITITNNDQ